MTPVSIYLDVDGVVNPFSPMGTTDWGSEWSTADAGILEVAFAPEAVAELNTLAEHPAARFVWLTTWEHLAPEFLCPAIGLNGRDWPVLSSQGWDQGPEWWKLVALQKDLAASASPGSTTSSAKSPTHARGRNTSRTVCCASHPIPARG
ncbi:hypothetical protein J2T11_000375 [Paenarthrobacter nicotinovorans]|uniref:HAD domain-containing protein n=1 Tax=Paenarthrobacter nicotinovorans TaxID=29320 RepID=UPI00277DB155|nr:HAD domain-containing protein [Paenarthrobacter nicotinovorans]MDP9934051.1 hypothetical protein [Paenarthrobacter nicotinovorans]